MKIASILMFIAYVHGKPPSSLDPQKEVPKHDSGSKLPAPSSPSSAATLTEPLHRRIRYRRNLHNYDRRRYHLAYREFREEYERHFTSHAEKLERRRLFENKLDSIYRSKNPNRGVTMFADWRPSERKAYGCILQKEGRRWINQSTPVLDLPYDDLPANYTCEGLTKAKNQRTCGACYAFVAAAIVKIKHNQRDGTKHSCSVQQIIDCSRGFGTPGCAEGGDLGDAFDYLINIEGLNGRRSYPYENKDTGPCRYDPTKRANNTSNQ